jgi:hypothetical protein
MSKSYLSNFFQEKKITYTLFEITDTNGLSHIIDTEFVIEAIFNAPLKEQQVICQTLKRLDFYNQSITDYLKFLAEVLVKNYNKAA